MNYPYMSVCGLNSSHPPLATHVGQAVTHRVVAGIHHFSRLQALRKLYHMDNNSTGAHIHEIVPPGCACTPEKYRQISHRGLVYMTCMFVPPR